jgi:hypothetical protein
MHRLPLISAFVDPFDLLFWLSPLSRHRPSRGQDAPEYYRNRSQR